MTNLTNNILVGVYGTLKSGEPNHALLSDSQYLGQAVTSQSYALADLKYYPGLIDGNQIISLEIYAITPDTLTSLDRLEGHPRLFVRREIPVTINGEVKTVLVYFFNCFNNQPLYKPDHLTLSWSSK